MANWTDAILTEKGKALAAKVMAGQLDLQLKEIWFGDGTPGTDLGSKKIKAELIKKSQEGTDCVIRFRVRNTTVQTPIIMSELGFYAVDADGSTILFSYMTDDEPATLPRYSGGKEYRQTMTSAFGFSNAEQVTLNATILDGQTEEDVDAAIAAHDANVDAHQFILNQINSNKSELNGIDEQIKAVLNTLLGTGAWNNPASNNIANMITLLGQGGIVAAKLENTGYVKFANGFTIQWGTVTVTTGVADDNKISEGEVVFTFPTAFTSAPWAIFTGALDTTNVRLESVSIYSNTPTNVVLYLDALGIANVKLSSFVLAIGK